MSMQATQFSNKTPHASRVFARSFVLTSAGGDRLSALRDGSPHCSVLYQWTHTFFGQYQLWYDPRLNYGLSRDSKFGVGVLGLCINPLRGFADNDSIAEELHNALMISESAFLEQVDELTGTFAILYRQSDKVFVLQDAAACKSIYFYGASDGAFSVTNNATLLALLHNLPADPACEMVWTNEDYKKDPSRYLPGLITPYLGAVPLTGNHKLDCFERKSRRFFPREPNEELPLSVKLTDQITHFFLRQAGLIGGLGRPLWLAATGGRDSRVTAATFASQLRLRFFSFHLPSINHLTEDVQAAKELAQIANVPISVFELENYRDPTFQAAFQVHSRRGIWPGAAQCYCSEFEDEAIHLRSTVSEIGRIFYGNRQSDSVGAEILASAYTSTPFQSHELVIRALHEFVRQTAFTKEVFYNYNLYDLFYWEHRNAKWQNILCAEAEMACDVFVPYNNRWLLKKMMAVPFMARHRADIHRKVWLNVMPEFDKVNIK
jgi:hypothetical protein